MVVGEPHAFGRGRVRRPRVSRWPNSRHSARPSPRPLDERRASARRGWRRCVSANTSTSQPIAFSSSRCGRSAASSAPRPAASSSAEYQPRYAARDRSRRAPLVSAAASRGNLWPSSMPSKPMRARLLEAGLERRVGAELAHVVVRPDDGVRAQADAHGSIIVRRARRRARVRSARARRRPRRAADTSGTGTSHQAPPAVVLAAGSVSIDDHRRCAAAWRAAASALAEPGDAVDPGSRVRRGCARGRRNRSAARPAPRAGRRLLKLALPVDVLQPVDAAEAAVVEQHDGELQPHQHRGGDLGVQHRDSSRRPPSR